jgi:hypothetical protein
MQYNIIHNKFNESIIKIKMFKNYKKEQFHSQNKVCFYFVSHKITITKPTPQLHYLNSSPMNHI